jgi:HK97 family phage portal protein
MASIRDYIKGFFNTPIQTKEAPQVVLSTTTSDYYRRDGYENYADDGYRKNAIVYRCVNEIANGAASMQWKAYQGDIELETHPILSLLNRPNPQQAGVEYFQSLYSYLLLSGNSYAVRSDVGGMPRELYLLRPDRMRVKASKTSIPAGYDYMLGGKVVKTYDADPNTGQSEVKHMKLWNPLDDYYGLSPLMAAAVDIDNHNEINKHNIALLRNGARPTGAIVFRPSDERGMPVQLSDGQRQQLNDDLRTRFQGSGNAGRPLLLEGDFDWKEMGLSPRDMDFLQQKHIAAKDIALCFGVPSQLIGIPDSQTYANVQEARLALYEETIIPLAKRVESDFNEWLAPMFGDDISVSYDFESIPAMTERRRRTYENVVAAVREGIISRNEARDRLGLEPITGGDDVFIAANLFPLGSTEVAPADGDEAEQDGKFAYGLKLEEYPDGEPVPENLPDAYQLGDEEKNCANCEYFEANGNCTVWNAIVRPEYVCARWEGEEDEEKQDPRFGEGRDVFDNVGAARRRADQLGCDGTHTLRSPDGNYYMPCSSHAIYLRVTGQPKNEDLGDDAKAESDVDTTPTDGMALSLAHFYQTATAVLIMTKCLKALCQKSLKRISQCHLVN